MQIEDFVEPSERLFSAFEVITAYILVVLFAIGVFDLAARIVELALAGDLRQPSAVVDLIDVVLLLFIIVEVYQTVVAYTREESVANVVIVAGLIAIARKIIGFRPGEYETPEQMLFAAVTFAVLLFVLVLALYVVRVTPDPRE